MILKYIKIAYRPVQEPIQFQLDFTTLDMMIGFCLYPTLSHYVSTEPPNDEEVEI